MRGAEKRVQGDNRHAFARSRSLLLLRCARAVFYRSTGRPSWSSFRVRMPATGRATTTDCRAIPWRRNRKKEQEHTRISSEYGCRRQATRQRPTAGQYRGDGTERRSRNTLVTPPSTDARNRPSITTRESEREGNGTGQCKTDHKNGSQMWVEKHETGSLPPLPLTKPKR